MEANNLVSPQVREKKDRRKKNKGGWVKVKLRLTQPKISSVCSLAILDQRENNAMNVLFPHTNHILWTSPFLS